jgi:lambda repressor-like predicted transcriptional regulator
MMHQEKPPCKGVGEALPETNVQAIINTATAVQRRIARKINGDGGLKPEAIRAMITLEDVNLRLLAELNGFTDPCFHQVINRERPGLRVRSVLAKAIGMDYETVWGEGDDV